MALADGIRTKLGYRICDWVGNTVVEPLPHLHSSTWTINGMQPGASGSVAIGNFTVPLYPPRSLEYRKYKGIYDRIKPGMRIEAYIANDTGEYMVGGSPAIGTGILSNAGTPVFTGIIHKLNKVLDKFELVGFDSLWLAQQIGFYPGMQYFSTGGGNLLEQFNDVENLILADDFQGSRFPSSITWATISGSGFSLVTDDGLKSYQNSSSGENILATTIAANPIADIATFASGDVVIIEAWFHLVGVAATNTFSSPAEIIYLSDSTGTNLFMARANCVGNGTTYDIKAELWHKTAGTYANDIAVTAFPGVTGDRRIQLVLIITGTATGAWNVRLLVSGKDTNCVVSYVPSSPFNLNNRYWGTRATNSGGGPTTTSFTRFYMKARIQTLYADTALTQVPVQPFTDNDGPAGTSSFNLTAMNGLTLLDLWSMGATLEGYIWRKDPIRLIPRGLGDATFPSNDTGDGIMWGIQGIDPGAGFDLSSTIYLNEESNIVSGGELANGESLGTEVRLGFDSSIDNDGVIFWPDLAGMLSLGQGNLADGGASVPGKAPLIIIDPVSATGLHDMLIARKMAETSGARKALTASGSKQFTIIRDERIASSRVYTYTSPRTGLPSGGVSLHAFKELDFVTLNCPSLDIFNQKVSIQSYTFRENSPTMDITLDQFSFRDKVLFDRRRNGSLDALFQTMTQRS